ncbi:MAG: O-antigen ligase family protein, partial [Candidatus Paceibacterota bacterium]
FVVIIFTSGTIFPYVTGKFVAFRILVGLSLIFFFLGIIFDKIRADKYWDRLIDSIKSPLGIVIGIFTFIFTLAGFFGIDPVHSFWSNFERGEGSLQIIFLYAFFLLLSTFLTEEKDWKKFFEVFVISAFLSILYGIGDGLGIVSGTNTPLNEVRRFGGSLGNPAYLATYLLFASFFSSYLLLSEKQNLKKSKKYLLISSIVIFIVFFLWAATRGAFLGLIGAGIVGAIYLFVIKKNWRKIISLITIGVLLVIGGGYTYKDSQLIQSLPVSRLYDLSLDTRNFQERLIMWDMTIRAVKDRPLLGYGAENFDHIFYEYYNPSYYDPAERGVGNFGPWFDRAHSTTFDYLSQTGVLGLISYWGIFAMFFLLFVKSKLHKRESAILATLILVMPVAYLIQGQVLFEILPLYLSFYVFLAFASFKLYLGPRET